MKKSDEITFLIIEYLKLEGLAVTDTEVAGNIGMSRQHLSNIKNTQQRFSFDTMCDFAKVYNINMNVYTSQSNVFNTHDSITLPALKAMLKRQSNRQPDTQKQAKTAET